MAAKTYDWSAIAQNPKYLQLKKEKRLFLFGWWLASSIYYFSLTILSAYFTEIFKIKVIGVINVGYLFILSQFVMAFFVAIYYTRIANSKFDPMTQALIDEIGREA